MNNQDFTTSFIVPNTAKEAFDAINNVRAWWTENVDGGTENLNHEFSVHFGDIHYSKHKLVEVVPFSKIVWLITESKLTFIKDQDEWTGSKIVFDIAEMGNKTQVRFTQVGLVPDMECFKNCSSAWTGFVQSSLKNLITTGKGSPTTLC